MNFKDEPDDLVGDPYWKRFLISYPNDNLPILICCPFICALPGPGSAACWLGLKGNDEEVTLPLQVFAFLGLLLNPTWKEWLPGAYSVWPITAALPDNTQILRHYFFLPKSSDCELRETNNPPTWMAEPAAIWENCHNSESMMLIIPKQARCLQGLCTKCISSKPNPQCPDPSP